MMALKKKMKKQVAVRFYREKLCGIQCKNGFHILFIFVRRRRL